MRTVLAFFFLATFAVVFLSMQHMLHAADFPPFDKLKAQSGLPDPLTMFDGSKVASKDDWLKKRRPELKKAFEHYMYGETPPAMKITAKIDRVDRKALGGKATLKQVTISLGDDVPKISVLVAIPNNRTKPAPVFVGMNFAGNHAVLNDPSIPLNPNWMYPNRKGVTKDGKVTDAARGTEVDVWNIEKAIDRGYAVVTFYSGDVQPDRPDVVEGFLKKLQKKAPSDVGTVAIWAWGIQRVIDYIVTDSDLDAGAIIVIGHSRLGKTALLAGAFDERIAAVIPHQAGCGGTAPSRGKVGESVKAINTRFPHWFNTAFKQFNDEPDKLPFDQHSLVALCAPRPVLLSNAFDDQWANPDGQFEMLVAADPVYKLLGVEGVASKTRPEVGRLMNSRLAYFIRNGRHSMNAEDWGVFLDFADKHVKR